MFGLFCFGRSFLARTLRLSFRLVSSNLCDVNLQKHSNHNIVLSTFSEVLAVAILSLDCAAVASNWSV